MSSLRAVRVDVARNVLISDKTVSTYKSRIQEKLGLSSLAALIEFATLHRLID
ncbi:LuxR C-terminal-related transcriptional regulator [Paraburkholderia nemoris]|uniref:LuxR C-terminal-related transcriptional regulator n=1 Tax=Paraburkholderia nemoris TaxID=2793076 RepID=UPI0038BB6A55